MSLLSPTHQNSDSGLSISLHPLVLLTISDYVTRHTLRRQVRPIVGALLGQQRGQSITLEHAFECETLVAPSSGKIILHDDWFRDRLQQYKDVHKAPALDLVGWFTTVPAEGPEAAHLPVHSQILQNYNETAVLLGFHPESVLKGPGVGGKLPLTIYESVYESAEGPEKGGMEIDGESKDTAGLDLRFRELPYVVDTGEAEMIGVDFVARGGGNATAIDTGAPTKAKGQTKSTGAGDSKGKSSDKNAKTMDDSSVLSAEDEELIASLTARANAVKMLHTRISLLESYLTSLPPSYLTAPTASTTTATTPTPQQPPATTPPTQTTQPNHPLLRSISSLLTRLPLLLPPTGPSLSEFNSQSLAEKSDVELVSLLGTLGRSVKDARELGRKFAVVEGGRSSARKMGPGGGGGGGGFGVMDLGEGNGDGDGSGSGGGLREREGGGNAFMGSATVGGGGVLGNGWVG